MSWKKWSEPWAVMMEHIPREFQTIIGCHSDVEIRPLKYHPVSDHGIGWGNLCPNDGH